MIKTLVVIILLGIVLFCSAETSKRDSKLFKKFPLHDSLKQVYSEQAGKLMDFSSIVQQVAQSEEKAHVEKIARALEKTSADDLSKVAKEQPLSYSVFHNYDAEAIVMYGKADLKVLRLILKDENYNPIVLGNTEYGLVAVWIMNNKDTSIGSFKQLYVTALVASKNLGYTLGVTYTEGNDAGLLFPAFGKLPEHSRHFVIHSAADQTQGKMFSEKVNFIPTSMMQAQSSDLQFSTTPIATMSIKGDSSSASSSSDTFTSFKFVDDRNELILEGKIKDDNSWKSWFYTTYDILKSLGLSGIIDLWYAQHVPAKLVTSAKSGNKWTTMNMDMKQSFHKITDFEFTLGERNEIGRKLRSLKFTPSMVVRMPLLQYAQMMPKDQSEDTEFQAPQEDLRWEDEEKVRQVLKQQQAGNNNL